MPAYGTFTYGGGPYANPSAGNVPASQLNGGQFPLLVIEAGFGFGALADPVTWTDITKYVRSYSINRGRQHELNKFEAGTASITLDNRDGRFSPFNTSSPYYPNVLPSVPIRIRAVWNGLIWPRFRGNVESWTLKWPTALDSEIVVGCVDAMKALNLKRASTMSRYTTTVLADSPMLYWRLGDSAGSVVAADASGNGRAGSASTIDTTGDPWFFGGEPGIVADSDTAFDCGTTSTGTGSGVVQAVIPTVNLSGVSMECWAKARSLGTDPTGVGTSANLMRLYTTGGSSTQLTLNINNSFSSISASGAPYVHFDNGSGTIVNGVAQVLVTGPVIRRADSISVPTADSLLINDGRWHHYVVTSDGTTIRLYVDGKLGMARTAASGAGGGMVNVQAGGFDGVVDEVAVYNFVMSAAQALSHYQAGALPRLNELSGTRIGAYLDAVGWASTLRNVDAGNSQLQPASADSYTRPVLANMQDVETTEAGELFVDAAGNVTFFDRLHTSRPPNSTVSVILGDSGTAAEEPYLLSNVDPTLDDTDIWNEITVTPSGMGAQTVGDTASQTLYGKRTRALTTSQVSPTEAYNRASAELNRYTYPLHRIRSVTFTPMSDPPVLFPAALGFDLLTRVELRRRMSDGSGAMFDQIALIEGLQENVDASKGSWQITWRLSSADDVTFGIFSQSNFGQVVFAY